tara:strand:- start:322 stop:1167 length:846 start_codon:yes stop_codon:yes gene_type:complete
MKNILITGSNGVLGKEMISLLKKKDKNFYKFKCRFETLNSDLCKLDLIKPSIIFHFGAQKPSYNLELSLNNYFESNVLLTFELSEYAKKNKIPFIYISTADLFNRNGSPKSELHKVTQTKDSITGKDYGWTKYLAEKKIIKTNSSAIIFRISTIYTKNDPENFSCAKFLTSKEICKNFKFNNKQYLMNFIRADNLCSAILEISQKELRTEIYHFTSSLWISNYDILYLFYKKFGIEFKYKRDTFCLPKRFNASNQKIRNSLKEKFIDCNYLNDLELNINKL